MHTVLYNMLAYFSQSDVRVMSRVSFVLRDAWLGYAKLSDKAQPPPCADVCDVRSHISLVSFVYYRHKVKCNSFRIQRL